MFNAVDSLSINPTNSLTNTGNVAAQQISSKDTFWASVVRLILQNPPLQTVRSELDGLARLEPRISRENLEPIITNIQESLFKNWEAGDPFDPIILHTIEGNEEEVAKDLTKLTKEDHELLSVAVQWAAYLGHTDILRLLLKSGVDVEIVSKTFRLATQSQTLRALKNTEVAKLLVDFVNDKGRSLLMHAAIKGDLELIQLLLKHGANINRVNSVGNSAIAYAREKGYVEIVKVLLDAGADPNLRNIHGTNLLTLKHVPHRMLTNQIIKSHPKFDKKILDYEKRVRKTKLLAQAFEVNRKIETQTNNFPWSGIVRLLLELWQNQLVNYRWITPTY